VIKHQENLCLLPEKNTNINIPSLYKSTLPLHFFYSIATTFLCPKVDLGIYLLLLLILAQGQNSPPLLNWYSVLLLAPQFQKGKRTQFGVEIGNRFDDPSGT
jgi:hypothetical protein